MPCQRCKKDRLIDVQAKCSDCCIVSYKKAENNGYVPSDIGIGGNNDVRLIYCLECGQIQGEWPLPEPDTSEDAGWAQPVCLTCDGIGELAVGVDLLGNPKARTPCHDCDGTGTPPEEGDSPSETGLAHERTRDKYAEGS